MAFHVKVDERGIAELVIDNPPVNALTTQGWADLARELRINPNTVIHAYRELEIENIIESRRGQGSFVTGAGPVMSLGNRRRLLAEKVDHLLVEAYHLNLTDKQVLEIVRTQCAINKKAIKEKEVRDGDE